MTTRPISWQSSSDNSSVITRACEALVKSFEDTVKNLLKMKPKPHKEKGEKNEGEPKPTPEPSEKPEGDSD